MANYFDSPATGFNQYRGKFLNFPIEHGIYTFATTGTTVSVPTYLSSIMTAIITPYDTLGNNETLFCTPTVSAGNVTVSRIANDTNLEFHFPIDEGQTASNDLDPCPLMIAQAAMTLKNVEFYKGTGFGGGTVIFNLGKSTDDGFYLEDQAVNETGGTTDTYTTFTSGTAAVADGDVIYAETEEGTTSGPNDMVVSMSATKTGASYTSALTFNYLFIGLG